ncbi:TPA: DUF551 domain-containing protein [Raoultella ornithinolytica]
MNKSTITRERLEKIKSWRETYGAGSNVMLPAEEAEELARMALAAMDSEPVAWLAIYHGEVYDEAIGITRSVVEAQADHFGWESALTEIIPLYRHAQQPVVPEEATSDSIEILASARRRDHAVFQWDEDQRNAAADSWNACRAAILAAAPQSPGSEPATVPGKWIPVSERMPDDDDFVYIWPRPDFGVELHVGQYCECSPKGDGWYAQVYEQNYGIEWYPITVTHWMPLPADPQEVNHG